MNSTSISFNMLGSNNIKYDSLLYQEEFSFKYTLLIKLVKRWLKHQRNIIVLPCIFLP